MAGDFGPGVGSVARRGRWLYFSGTCQGAVHRIPVASFYDTTRSPQRRADDIELVSPRPADPAGAILEGLTFNRFDPSDDDLYALEAAALRLVRINTRTGARTVLGADPTLFLFPEAAAFHPPVAGLSPLVLASDQERRFAAINAAIPSDRFTPPWRLTRVYVTR